VEWFGDQNNFSLDIDNYLGYWKLYEETSDSVEA